MSKLNASEALYGFAAWLTTRYEPTTLGAKHDCAPVVDRIVEFIEANDLPPLSATWPNNLVFPSKPDDVDAKSIFKRAFLLLVKRIKKESEPKTITHYS